jgi:hypothetical protein
MEPLSITEYKGKDNVIARYFENSFHSSSVL